MPLTPAHKLRSREKILDSAFKLFTRQGFDNTSIDEVMKDAGLTRGAFYAHFSSKSDLYKEALLNAAVNSYLMNEKPGEMTDGDWLNTLIEGYLSMDHVNLQTTPCSLAFLTTDIAIREDTVRETYTSIFKGMNTVINGYAKAHPSGNAETILAVTAMLVGAVSIGRALTEENLTEKLLESCRATARALLETAPLK